MQNEREWAAFCTRVLQQPALAADPRYAANERRVAAQDALRTILAEAFAGLAAGSASLLAGGGLLALYGPFRFNGQCCGLGNERFDAMLVHVT